MCYEILGMDHFMPDNGRDFLWIRISRRTGGRSRPARIRNHQARTCAPCVHACRYIEMSDKVMTGKASEHFVSPMTTEEMINASSVSSSGDVQLLRQRLIETVSKLDSALKLLTELAWYEEEIGAKAVEAQEFCEANGVNWEDD